MNAIQTHCDHKVRLLRNELHGLIENHGLAEVLDRLADAVDNQRQLDAGKAYAPAWSNVANLLEKATDAAIDVTVARLHDGEPRWK